MTLDELNAELERLGVKQTVTRDAADHAADVAAGFSTAQFGQFVGIVNHVAYYIDGEGTNGEPVAAPVDPA